MVTPRSRIAARQWSGLRINFNLLREDLKKTSSNVTRRLAAIDQRRLLSLFSPRHPRPTHRPVSLIAFAAWKKAHDHRRSFDIEYLQYLKPDGTLAAEPPTETPVNRPVRRPGETL
ncbi:MAG: hypothetical protein R3F22_05655 [Lysobacteraceae bacterium]